MSDANGVTLLLVEDNRADVVFFKEAIEASRIPASVHVAVNGQEALQFLRGETPFGDAPMPDVVVLDLNLPIMNGRELLAELMADLLLNHLPVAVLTTATSEGSVCELCPPGQCLYFSKTDDFDRLQEIIREVVLHARNNHKGAVFR